MIKALDLQAFLFEDEVTRAKLIDYSTELETTHRVFVCRNHSFELIENTITPYLEYSGLRVEFSYSSYDDSLSFLELDSSVDLVVLWLDLSDYADIDLLSFLNQRVQQLRGLFSGEILLAAYAQGEQINYESLQVAQYRLDHLQARLGESFFDLRLEPFSGTKLSNAASLKVSRDLGLNYLPALLIPNIKGIVVDLDNTLYHGVLGEDGVQGVVLTDGHRKLQKRLKNLSEQGFFLSIASKNDESDVLRLFQDRSDFPLQLEDFVEIRANWNTKAESISDIARILNISSDSLLFIDDNLGELVSVLESHPLIKVIWAKEDAIVTHTVLSNYPGLLKFDSHSEDRIRKSDTLANKQRLSMRGTLSQEDYIKDLKMSLVYAVDDLANLDRITELANKTNQFIFSYQRYTQNQIQRLMRDNDSVVVSVSLSDRLSDSGIIGVVVLLRDADVGVLQECFVSCRALGRGVDEAIVLGGIGIALDSLQLSNLRVQFEKGERNLPAEKFCRAHLNRNLDAAADFGYQIPTKLFAVDIKSGQTHE